MSVELIVGSKYKLRKYLQSQLSINDSNILICINDIPNLPSIFFSSRIYKVNHGEDIKTWFRGKMTNRMFSMAINKGNTSIYIVDGEMLSNDNLLQIKMISEYAPFTNIKILFNRDDDSENSVFASEAFEDEFDKVFSDGLLEYQNYNIS